MELLETRDLLATFHVVTQGDADNPIDPELLSEQDLLQFYCTNVRCTLRDAIFLANLNDGPDTITFSFTDPDPHDQIATVTLDSAKGPLVVEESLSIEGADVASVHISGNNGTRIFEFPFQGDYLLEGLTLSHGNGDGTDNDVDGSGGAINSAAPQTKLTIRDSLIRENSGSFGGAIAFFAGELNIVDTSIINNQATEIGGAMVVAGDISLQNVTVSGNEVPVGDPEDGPEAGGIAVQTVINQGGGVAGTDILISQSTIANNQAATAANLLVGAESANVNLRLEGSIIADPLGGGTNVDTYNVNATVNVTSLGYNLVDDDSLSLKGTGDITDTDALLAPLSENDCPVCPILSGHELLHGSPAIDGAANVGFSTDQRGLSRDIGIARDMGGFEAQFDFGDAKPGFPTQLLVDSAGDVIEDGARHIATGAMLGVTRSAEGNGVPSAAADGDGGDEDGVVIGDIILGEDEHSIQVTVSGGDGRLDAWIDFNASDSWDSTEQIFDSQLVLEGQSTLMFSIPEEVSACVVQARFRLSSSGGLESFGPAADGEVEDYNLTVLGCDYGDAPDTGPGTGPGNYQTLAADDGASHLQGGPQLGSTVDIETEGLPTEFADGDDVDAQSDEDGVAFGEVVIGQQGTSMEWVVEIGNAAGKLDAWIDLDRNGSWLDAGEQILTSEDLDIGINELTIELPQGTQVGETYTRFRVSTAGGLAPTGTAADGEVEDHWIGPIYDYGDAPDGYPTARGKITGPHLFLGENVDQDRADQTHSHPAADGDMYDDGVEFNSSIVAFTGAPTISSFALTANGDVQAGGLGKVSAWMDFNQDGDWDDPDERILSGEDVRPGQNIFDFVIPAGSLPGDTFARFRINSGPNNNPDGMGDGEIEDYMVTIVDGNAGGGAAVAVAAPATGTLEVVQGSVIVRTRNPDKVLFTAPDGAVSTITLTGTEGDDVLGVEAIPNLDIVGDALGGFDTLKLLGGDFDLDLTMIPDSAIQGIEAIDITGSGDNSIILDAAEVTNISPSTDTLMLKADAGDSLDVGPGWEFDKTEVESGEFVRVFTQGDATIRSVGPHQWSNPIDRFDINADGIVAPLDVLIVINEVNNRVYSDGELVDAASLDPFPNFFYDAFPDDRVIPQDVLVIINFINSEQASPESEGTSVLGPSETPSVIPIVSSKQVRSLNDAQRDIFDQAIQIAPDGSWYPQVVSASHRSPDELLLASTNEHESLDAFFADLADALND